MKREKPSGARHSDLIRVHADAAAIDIGATMHMAAVGADLFDRTGAQLRHVHRRSLSLDGLVHGMRREDGGHGIDRRLLDSDLRTAGCSAGSKSFWSMRATPRTCPVARPTSATLNGCSGFIPMVCCAPASGLRARSPSFAAYLRQRERLLDYAASHIQHMQKALTEMNLQLHHVVSDVTGATGLRIVRAIIAGERDPAVLALLRDTRCHANAETIQKALVGHYRPEHLFALEQALGLYEAYQERRQSLRHPDRGRPQSAEHPSRSTKRSHASAATAGKPAVERTRLRCAGCAV